MTDATSTPERVYQPINFDAKLALIHDHWKPRVVAEMNDYQFKIVKIQGDFLWHDHADTDETFVVPRGVEHKPYAEREVKMMLIEPRGVVNTGTLESDRRAENDVWI
jgi:mannose-6-phosphate isomerase-like protein (cupin superfamily)